MSIAGIKVLTVGKSFPLPFEVRHTDDSAQIQSLIAQFQPDVIVTSTFMPGVLNLSAFEIRKRWIHVDQNATPDRVVAAIESCYVSNLWGEHEYSKDNPLISVYTGTYNTGDYLRDTYQSLREQTHQNWEWVIVDDHSTDGTWERLEQLAAEDIRVRPIRNAKNIGKIGAVKDTATRLCRGVYLVELDHDDMLTDFALAEIKKAFEENPDAGMVYSNCSNYFEDGTFHRFTDDFWKSRYRETEYRGKKWVECLQPNIYDRFTDHFTGQFGYFLTVGPNHVRAFHAKTLFELGGYNRNLLVADDFDLYARFFLESRCVLIDKLLYLYRFKDAYLNTTFVRNKAIQDHLSYARGHYQKKFEIFNQKRLDQEAARNPEQNKPCFVIASRSEEDAKRVKEALQGHDVFVKVGASSILQAYEEGRLHWKDRRRIVYVHDDVVFKNLEKFIEKVRSLPAGLHGPCGSQALDARDKANWWDAKPLAGAYAQHYKDGAPSAQVRFQNEAAEVAWLDGFCLITVNQKWSWKVQGDPKIWHGYDWLAAKRTVQAGGKCWTLGQEEILLGHEGYGRIEGYDQALKLIRILSTTAEERRDYPNIAEHLPLLKAAAHGTILELGSRRGASTTALLEGVELKGGHVFSVDVDPSCADAWEGHPQWTFIAGDSCDAKKVEEAGLNGEIDVLFVDSEHNYDQVMRELRTWFPKMKPGGVIFIHDTESFPEVKRAAQEFASKHGLKGVFRTNCNGLGIFAVPKKLSMQDVSFIVLEAAETALTSRCMDSIRKYAPGAEIVYVANGVVTQDERIWDKEVCFNVNLGFAVGCNAGARAATRPILCFMNNDAAFVDETPTKLLSALGSHHIVAPYSNRAKPPQGDIARENVPAEGRLVDMVVGLCMMTYKSVFEQVGGFDPDLLTYEDDQFCRKAAQQGYTSFVVGGAWVEHERHETFRKLNLDVNKVMAENREIFQKKNPVIRVIVIAKDEEKALEGFFQQWAPLTKDWCVLDTGSKDGTVFLAKRLGCKVEVSGFKDFADARNEAIRRFGAGADWIVMIDPDERMDEHTIRNVKEFLYRTDADILYSPLQAKYPGGSVKTFVSKPFCWRNKPEIKWVFKVHEKLIGSKNQAIVMNATNFHLIELHEDGRRQAALDFYDGLMKAEPYFTDPAYKAKMIGEWPILDYDRMDDARIKTAMIGPLVSVVVPTYKRPELLDRAIESALNQDYQNLEVVVVGDNCPDLSSRETTHRRMRMYNLKKNHGAGGAVPRNHAIAAAGGSLIAYLDDDNMWKPNHVSSLYQALRLTGAAFAFSSMEVNGKDLSFKEPKQGGIDTSCVLHKKELIAKYGNWKDRVAGGYAHDWEFISRWVAGGEKWVATKKPTLIYNAETSGQKEFLEALAAKVGSKEGV